MENIRHPHEADAPKSDADVLFDYEYDIRPETARLAENRAAFLALEVAEMLDARTEVNALQRGIKKLLFVFTGESENSIAPNNLGIYTFYKILKNGVSTHETIIFAEQVADSYIMGFGNDLKDLVGESLWEKMDGNLKLIYCLGYMDGSDLFMEPCEPDDEDETP